YRDCSSAFAAPQPTQQASAATMTTKRLLGARPESRWETANENFAVRATKSCRGQCTAFTGVIIVCTAVEATPRAAKAGISYHYPVASWRSATVRITPAHCEPPQNSNP